MAGRERKGEQTTPEAARASGCSDSRRELPGARARRQGGATGGATGAGEFTPAQPPSSLLSQLLSSTPQVSDRVQAGVQNHAYLTSDTAHRVAHVAQRLNESDACSGKFISTLKEVVPACGELMHATGPRAVQLCAHIQKQIKGAAYDAVAVDATRASIAQDALKQADKIRQNAALMGQKDWILKNV